MKKNLQTIWIAVYTVLLVVGFCMWVFSKNPVAVKVGIWICFITCFLMFVYQVCRLVIEHKKKKRQQNAEPAEKNGDTAEVQHEESADGTENADDGAESNLQDDV